MSKSVDFEKIKQQTAVFMGVVQRKFVYLVGCINRFGFNGVAWWFKTHGQVDELKIALDDLRANFEKEDVSLSIVERILGDFKLPEEDLGHVFWYTDAHKKLDAFETKLTDKKIFDIKLLQKAMNELKFIGQANQFHQIYQLEAIQQRIKDMYQVLQKKIVEQQALEKQKLEADKKQQMADLAKSESDKVAAIAKAKTMEAVKIKEKRLAIIEEKKRQELENQAQELKMKEQNEQAEIRAKEAEAERQSKLQESYRELEIQEKIKELPLEELLDIVNQKVENKTILTFIQLDKLSKLQHTMEQKKA